MVPRGDADGPPVETEFHTEPGATTTCWNGDRLDRDWAVAVLAERRHRARLSAMG